MAWWTVSRAIEFAGGAAYIFLPGFQNGKDGDGARDAKAKASDDHGSVDSTVVGHETDGGKGTEGRGQSSGGDDTSSMEPTEVASEQPTSGAPVVDD